MSEFPDWLEHDMGPFWNPSKTEADTIHWLLRRQDLLLRALRQLVEAVEFEGEGAHYDTVIANCYSQAKALCHPK